ncbi:UDP-glucuronosyltransferase 3A1-like isoform X2 [Pseudophryne corroboree]|uniref:UDP-glucuronosyltransferase 3A1-like isoform X2 n=1 Tax=Pseudophryne corroboree TaxID=495146 RepID=UPI0030820F4E
MSSRVCLSRKRLWFFWIQHHRLLWRRKQRRGEQTAARESLVVRQARREIQPYFRMMGLHSDQCNVTLNQSLLLQSLRDEKYDVAIVDAHNPCTLLVSEALGLPYIAFFPMIFANAPLNILPVDLSYVPLFQSQLSDRIDFLGRLQNTIMYFGSLLVEMKIEAIFLDPLKGHFPDHSRPSLSDLYRKAELWIFNLDFTIELPRPLLPHIQYIGGLLAKPANPLSQELEDYISESGESGFIVVTLGSMISSSPQIALLKEMNAGFARIPQIVIWRFQRSHWPKELQLAPNVRLLDWVSQNDLLGHPKIRLLVTHGGLNSLMEAVYHGVPVLGIPLFGDQFDNLVRITAKHMGTFIPVLEIKSESFANTMRHVIENKSYKMSAMNLSVIRKSRPFPPDQQLLRWVEHIIQSGGGGHLHPYSYQQPWYQQYLLDVILFLCLSIALILYLIVKIFKLLIGKICFATKQKMS